MNAVYPEKKKAEYPKSGKEKERLSKANGGAIRYNDLRWWVAAMNCKLEHDLILRILIF